MAKLTIFRFRGHISREERFRQLFVEIYPRLLRYARSEERRVGKECRL